MALLAVRNLSLKFGGPSLFDDVTFQVEAGERVCLIGRNGAGKSSLLKIITGTLEPDAGEVAIARGSHAAFLSQEVPDAIAGTVRDVVLSGLGEAGEKIRAYETHDTENYSEAELDAIFHWLENNSAWSLSSEVDAMISKIGAVPDLPFSSLSAGMKRRVLLARELVSKPDILVLDEPTNHLDIDAIEWLEEFLLSWQGAILFVTHDRRFLKKISTRILDLEGGIITSWDCDYDTYLTRREELNASIAANNAEFDKLLAREEAWLRQGVKARRCRNEGRVRELKKLREIRAARRASVGNVRATISEGEKSGAKVLVAENISQTWNGVPAIRDFSTTIMRGDRVGIIGPNGIGKTTLLKILLGQLTPDSGTVTHGTNLQIAYFDQLRSQLKEDKTLIENLAGEGADTVVVGRQTRHVISYLGDFLFTPDRARSTVSMLSGGERNRLLLAKIFLKTANVLVLDEPTNDLDLETLDLLEELLGNFDGTVLLVTHDRQFLDNVTTSYIVFEGDGNLREFVGDYDAWRKEHLADVAAKSAPKTEKPKAEVPAEPVSPKNPPSKKKLSYKETRELEALPQQIEDLENEQKTLAEKLNDPDFYRDPVAVQATNTRLAEIDEALLIALERWEELESRKGA
ncbi:MAG: ATP-binding cassette domain-containing protein [Opitutales bacterium]|nr:ATP-binding cassette domain-containing protein [Opitutales bacterium]